jgi:hypothetical protein
MGTIGGHRGSPAPLGRSSHAPYAAYALLGRTARVPLIELQGRHRNERDSDFVPSARAVHSDHTDQTRG